VAAVTASAVLLDTAEEVARWLRHQHPTVTPRNIRQWAKRGHITRHPCDLYVAIEVVDYLEQRPDIDRRRASALARCAESPRLTQ
jgi:hypothetical protein